MHYSIKIEGTVPKHLVVEDDPVATADNIQRHFDAVTYFIEESDDVTHELTTHGRNGNGVTIKLGSTEGVRV